MCGSKKSSCVCQLHHSSRCIAQVEDEGRLELPNRMRGQTLDRRVSSRLYYLADSRLRGRRADRIQYQGNLQVNFFGGGGVEPPTVSSRCPGLTCESLVVLCGYMESKVALSADTPRSRASVGRPRFADHAVVKKAGVRCGSRFSAKELNLRLSDPKSDALPIELAGLTR